MKKYSWYREYIISLKGMLTLKIIEERPEHLDTRYELDGPGIESRWGRDFPHPSWPALGPTKPPYTKGTGSFLGGESAGAWRWPPTPFIAEFNERVELYLYSPSWPSGSVIGWTSALPAICCGASAPSSGGITLPVTWKISYYGIVICGLSSVACRS
jgi:hypothetical protein